MSEKRFAESESGYRICLVKGDERYLIDYTKETAPEALRQLGRWAQNKELSFTWYDAAVLSAKIRANVSSSSLEYTED